MLKRLKSKTNIGTVTLFVQAIGLSNPIWEQLSIAGVSDQAVAIGKIIGMAASLALAVYGREVAAGPLRGTGK